MRAARTLLFLGLCALLPSGEARADLKDDTERLIAKWSSEKGTTVEHRPPLFLESGHATHLRLAPAVPSPEGAPAPAKKAACATVVLVSPRASELAFLTNSGEKTPLPAELPFNHPVIAEDANAIQRSKNGVAMLSRCGKEQVAHPLEDERFLAQTSSPRTAVEVLVVRSGAAIESPQDILPERVTGPSAPRGNAGRPLDPGPIADRIANITRRNREEGTERIVKVPMRSSARGGGSFVTKLGEGCHSLDVLADTPPKGGVDVDAEAHVSDTGRLLAKDRGEAADAHLEFCLGEPTIVEVAFHGAIGALDVTLIDALWPLPAGVPSEWGPRARGDIAAALRRRHASALPSEPIESVLGAHGETLSPFAVEPGACYLAVAAPIRGDVRSLRLAVEIGDRAPHDEIADRAEAAQVAFCATTEDRAALRVVARGGQPWWLGLVWRITR